MNDNRKKAVVVDDDGYFRDILEKTLEGEFEVRAVTGGEAGLRACLDEAPDVVLLDMFMPGLCGPGFVDALRTDPRTRALPVVAFSAARFDAAERGAFLSRPGVRALLDKVEGPRAFLAAARAAAG